MLDKAIEKCLELPFVKGQRRLYAIVSDKRGNIVGEASNNYTKSHTVQAYYAKKAGLEPKIYLHSEIHALLRARGKGYKISVARVDSKGNLCYAAPCRICSIAIKESGIKQVEYTI